MLKVREANIGSLYQITYRISLKSEGIEKVFIDKIRCRNGNLDIICGQIATTSEIL